MILGCPYAHAEYIGALLADALGYGYIDVRYSVPLSLDRTPADPEVIGARLEFARHLSDNESAIRRNVWSLTDYRVLPEIMSDLKAAPVGCAVYVRSEDELLERGAEVWNVPPDEMLRSNVGTIESDRVADVAMLAAVDVWRDLRNWRFVPDAVRGRLASMFDARGRQLGDPRLSMVRAQANMPRKR